MDEPPDAWDELLAQLADRPFGDTERVSGRTLQPFSLAGQRVAANLLGKAARALASGDPVRARAHVDRAARLRHDRREEAHPAACEASMAFHASVSDALELSDEGDLGWLQALALVAESTSPTGRLEVRAVLDTLHEDHDLTRAGRAAVRALAATIPAGVDLRDRELTEAELAEAVMEVLVLCEAYESALDSPVG